MLAYALILIPFVLYIIKKFANGRFTKLRKDMTGKVIIITGSSAGLGKGAAFDLLSMGAEVIFACRDEAKTLKVINSNPNKEAIKHAHFFKLDLTSFNSVYDFANKITKKFPKIDILMNNAGLFPTKYYLTEDNIESAFQTNVLSHILLTYLLLPNLNKHGGRVINLSSHFHIFANYTLENLEELTSTEMLGNSSLKYKDLYYGSVLNASTLYGNTKVGNIFFTQALAEFFEKNYPGIKAASLHPGAVYTDFTSNSMSASIITRMFYYIVTPLLYLFMKSPIAGTQTQLDLAYMNNEDLVNGAYYENCRINNKVSKAAKDEKIRDAFMKYCHETLKKHCSKENKEIWQLVNQ